MLKLIDNANELDFLPADPFCAKITAIAETYGTGYDFARFYIQGQNAAVSITDGNAVLWADEQADCEELKTFFDVMGFSTLQAEEGLIRKLGFTPDDSSFIVKYEGEVVNKPQGFVSEYDYKNIYNLLTECGFEMGEYDSFLADICARINKGTARFGGIAEGGLESCAFRLFEGPEAILLGAVATSPLCRGKGLAGSLVPYMADLEKPTFLFCRNDGLVKFYESIGFTCLGRWATVTNKRC